MELFLRTLGKLSLLGSLLAVVLTALRPLLRGRVSRAAAYYLWLPVLLRLCIPAGINLPAPAATEEPAAAPPPYVQAAPASQPDVPPVPDGTVGAPEPVPQPDAAITAPEQPETVPYAPGLSERLRDPELWVVLWGTGALASVIWFTRGYLRASGMVRRSAGAASPEALGILRELDPRGRVQLVESPAVNTPLLLGAVRPVIALPAGVTEEARLQDILSHELTHVRRHDLLVKWFAAVVTSLHWFNPVMPLVRREIGRACELSCDEAVLRHMDEAGRRHYGETLLALAAHAPKGLGPMAATLCEEKKQLKERLFCIVKYKKSGPMVVFLSLLLAAVVGACSLVNGVKPAEPNVPEPDPGGEQTPPAETGDVTVCELDGGLTIAFPAGIADQLIIIPGGDESWSNALLTVYEKQSYEETLADWGYEGGGYLFGIDRYTQAQYEQYLTEDGSGISPFATDGTYYYMHTFATDVQFYRSEMDEYNDDVMEPWQQLAARVSDILGDFADRNELERFSQSSREFSYDSVHRYVLFRNGDWNLNMTLTLSQPAVQGEGGIWCVERCRDSYGNTSLQFPGDGVTPAAEYYAELQARADAGEHPELLDPMGAALAWIQDYYSYTDALTVTMDNLTMVEGEPAGNAWGRIWDILNQDGTLALGIYDDEGNPGSHVETFRVPAYESYHGLSGDAATSLGPRDWIKAEPVTDYWWRAVCYTAENGDCVFFLRNDGLVCVRQGGTEEWFRNAAWHEKTPYEVMYGICAYCARYTGDGTELLFTDEEAEAAVETVRQMFEPEPWGTAAALTDCRWDPAESQWQATTFLENGRGSMYGATRENTIVISGTYTTGDRQAVQGTTLEPENTYEWHFWLVRADKDSPWEIVDMGV